jgi:hypothetical protein
MAILGRMLGSACLTPSIMLGKPRPSAKPPQKTKRAEITGPLLIDKRVRVFGSKNFTSKRVAILQGGSTRIAIALKSLGIILIEAFAFCSCAGPQQQQVYAAYDAYDHTRCVGYGFAEISPEYIQCRQLLSEMRAGGPLGILAGSTLDLMIQKPVVQPNTPVDFSAYGAPAPEIKPGPAVNSQPPPQRSAESAEVYGTGFYVSRDGDVITNWHVAEKCVTMRTPDGIALSYVDKDKGADLALLHAVGKQPTSIAAPAAEPTTDHLAALADVRLDTLNKQLGPRNAAQQPSGANLAPSRVAYYSPEQSSCR